MRKSGFTLAEFLVTLVVMMVVMASACPVLFKKVSKERGHVAFTNGRVECTVAGCRIDTLTEKNGSTMNEFVISSADRAEFVKIRVVGGGAGAAISCADYIDNSERTCFGGGAGEVKTIIYPAMKGTYRVVIGSGGAEGQNGSASALYKKAENTGNDNTWELIASARGGVATNESALTRTDFSGGILETTNGKGGSYSLDPALKVGNSGEVVLTW